MTCHPATDSFGRTIDYLRLSVTDRCNERCLYCMPEGYRGWAQRADHLDADEIVQVVEAACRFGFRKFRVTGGEPLVRRDIVEILRRLRDLPGVQTLGISTNGTRLASLAPALRQAGVQSVNISLDALDPVVYRRITGGRVETVLEGIEAALSVGFEAVKLNCVLMRGINEDQLHAVTEFALKREMPLRFIELMPLSDADVLTAENFLSVGDAMQILETRGNLIPDPDARLGFGPARYYRFRGAATRIGFIGAMTSPHFCETCNKLRLTADGKLRPCLGRHGELDLLAVLRAGGDVAGVIREAIARKPENHQFAEDYQPGRPMTAIGG